MEHHNVQAQGPPLSAKVSFVSIDPADVKLPGDDQRVLNLVFKVTPLVRLDLVLTYEREAAIQGPHEIPS